MTKGSNIIQRQVKSPRVGLLQTFLGDFLFNKIKNDPDMEENMTIQQFSSESVTSERFKAFIEIVKNTGYTIYKVEKL